MQKRKLTQEDIDNNKELSEQGLKPGDEIEIPDENENSGSVNDDSVESDTGGSNPPPNKERP